MDVFRVLRRPLVTEKSTLLGEQNKYVFEIERRANKPQVKEAVERAFEVTVTGVNIVNVHAEWRRMGKGRPVLVGRAKKAIVTHKQGDSIQIFEGA